MPGSCVLPGHRSVSCMSPAARPVPSCSGSSWLSASPCSQRLAAGSRVSAGRCLVPRQALGFVTHGRAPAGASLLLGAKGGAGCPGWVCSVPVGPMGWGVAGPTGSPPALPGHRGRELGSRPQILLQQHPRSREPAPAPPGSTGTALPRPHLWVTAQAWTRMARPCGAVPGAGSTQRPAAGGLAAPRSPRLAAACCVSLCTFLLCRGGCYATSGSGCLKL